MHFCTSCDASLIDTNRLFQQMIKDLNTNNRVRKVAVNQKKTIQKFATKIAFLQSHDSEQKTYGHMRCQLTDRV